MKNIFFIAFCCVLFSCSSSDDSSSETQVVIEEVCPDPRTGEVTYSVSSQSENLFITYSGINGLRESIYVNSNTWNYSFIAEEGTVAYVSIYIPDHTVLTNIEIRINDEILDSVGCSSSGAASNCFSIAVVPPDFAD